MTFNLLVPPGGGGSGAPGIPNSPSFSISPDGKTSSLSCHSGQLTASEIFSGSNQLIKRPSTMLAADAMTEFAQALSSSGSAGAQNHQQQQHNNNNNHHHHNQNQNLASSLGLGRNRRQAIVPPKLATDPDNDDDGNLNDDNNDYCDNGGHRQRVDRLVDLSDDTDNNSGNICNDNHVDNNNYNYGQFQRRASADELTYTNARRKRSGGDPIGHNKDNKQSKPISGCQDDDGNVLINVPSFTINDHDHDQQHRDQNINVNFSGQNEQNQNQNKNNNSNNNQANCELGTRSNSALGAANLTSRPDSQMTNPESFASSTSANSL